MGVKNGKSSASGQDRDTRQHGSAVLQRLARTIGLCIFLSIESLAADPTASAICPTNSISLFNGRDFSGLYSWLVDAKRLDPRHVFTITNQWLHISGDGLGYLATTRAYRNYHLVVEFKWGATNSTWGGRLGKARDSGIFLHATGPDGNSHDGRGAFMAAIECNLFEGATGDLLLIRGNGPDGSLIAPRLTAETAEQRDGDGWWTWKRGGQSQTLERWGRLNWSNKDSKWEDRLDFRGVNDVESCSGDWTRVECLCENDRIAIKVNGVLVNQASSVWPNSGKILLQCEGSEIFFRRFELLSLRLE